MLILLQIQCYDIEFTDPNPILPQSAIHILLTNTGLEKYSKQQINFAISQILSQMKLPEQQMTMMGIEVIIKNGIFTSLQIDDLNTNIYQNTTSLHFFNIALTLRFELEIHQNQFPFLSDSGSLTMDMSSLSISSLATVLPNDTCPGASKVQFHKTQFKVEQFTFQFQCGLQVIFNAISSLLQQEISTLINGELGAKIAQEIMQNIVDFLVAQSEVSKIGQKGIATDQRVIGGIIVQDGIIGVTMSGGRCLLVGNKECFGESLAETIRLMTYFTDHDVQYQIERAAFNSGLDLFVKEGHVIGDYELDSIQVEQIHNTGAKIVVELSKSGEKVRLVFLETISVEKVGGSVVFPIRLSNLVESSDVQDDQVSQIMAYFNQYYDGYDLSLANSQYVDVANQITIYLNPDWIHIGAGIIEK